MHSEVHIRVDGSDSSEEDMRAYFKKYFSNISDVRVEFIVRARDRLDSKELALVFSLDDDACLRLTRHE